MRITPAILLQNDDKEWLQHHAGSAIASRRLGERCRVVLLAAEGRRSASAVRNAPTLQHSINHLLDEMELIALEKHAVKDNCDISRVLKTERGELYEDGDFSIGKPGAGGAEASEPGARTLTALSMREV